MEALYESEVNTKELDLEALAEEGMKLLVMEIDELYATLGGQLLAKNQPTRVGGIVCYLSSVRSTCEAKTLHEALLSESAIVELARGLGVIHEDLRRDGIRYLAAVSGDLQSVMCNNEIIRLCDQLNRFTMKIVITLVGVALRMPREFEPISVTVAVILLKLGLRDFCK